MDRGSSTHASLVNSTRNSRAASTCTCALKGLLSRKKPPSKQSLEPGLESWLRQRGLPEQKVEIALFKQQGRGLLATSQVRKGERLLSIPQQVLLTPDAAVTRSRLGRDLEKEGVPAWSALAVALVESRFVDPDSEWRPYAQALPQATGCVLEWGSEEVALLEGSSLQAAAQEIVAAAARSIEELEPIIKRAEKDDTLQQGAISRKRLLWAFGMLLSRLVRLPSWNNTEALCPWADMINHDCRVETHLDYDPASKSVCLQPDQNIQAGQQVMGSYGPKTSGQLLLSYGFAPPASENPHDGCHLQLSLSSEDPLLAAKTAALQQFGIKATQDFPLRMNALPEGAVQFAAYMDAQPSDDAEAAELADWLFGKGQFPKLDGVDTELLGIEVLRDECRAALEGYPQSVEELQKALQQLQSFQSDRDSSAATPSTRKALITAVKLQEQKVLHRSLFILQQRRKQIST